MVTQEILKSLFDYDEVSGNLIWKINHPGVMNVGKIAGSYHQGYIRIVVNGKKYLSHRLIWLMNYGYWPSYIDHINGVRNDNRLSNLRIASMKFNSWNQKITTKNTSGIKNVFWHPQAKKWRVRVWAGGKGVSGGLYSDKNDAKIAAINLRNKLHGEFARHE